MRILLALVLAVAATIGCAPPAAPAIEPLPVACADSPIDTTSWVRTSNRV